MHDLIFKISEIYIRYGIKSITMDDLARELGISKKTLYLHYHDKKDVVRKVVNHLLSLQKDGISKVMESKGANAIDKLMMMTSFIADHLKSSNPSLTYDLQKHFHDIWAEVMEFKRHAVYHYIMENIKEGITQGLYRTDINYEIISRAYVARMEMYQTDLWQPLEKFSLHEVFSTLFIYHIRGISTTKGLKYLDDNIHQWKLSS